MEIYELLNAQKCVSASTLCNCWTEIVRLVSQLAALHGIGLVASPREACARFPIPLSKTADNASGLRGVKER
jgi:hypothetical protein